MHKVAIISGQATFTGLSLPADDMQFVQQRELSTREIARVFGVPAHMIDGATGDSLTYANVEQQSLQFVTYSLRPWLCLIEQAISADPDLCSQNVYVEFLIDALLRADSKSRAETYALALDPVKGWMTRDEVRQRENLQAETNPQPSVPSIPQPQFNGAVA